MRGTAGLEGGQASSARSASVAASSQGIHPSDDVQLTAGQSPCLVEADLRQRACFSTGAETDSSSSCSVSSAIYARLATIASAPSFLSIRRTGNRTINRVSPAFDSTSISPPCLSPTMPWLIVRPRFFPETDALRGEERLKDVREIRR